MDRGTRTLIVVGVSVILAGVATWAVYRLMPKTPKDTNEDVVVVIRKMEIGTILSKDDVKVVKWPQQNAQAIRALNDKVYAKVEDVLEKEVGATLDPGDPVKESKLEKTVVLPIELGHRAMSVSVNEVINVAGYVQPDTRVDVIVTERTGSNRASRIVLKDVRVLSAGTKGQQMTINKRKSAEMAAKDKGTPTKELQPLTSTVVTLEVTPDEAEKLALAQNDGNITLALRPRNESQGGPDTKKKTWADLMGAAPRVESAAPQRVTIYAGTKSTSQEVKR